MGQKDEQQDLTPASDSINIFLKKGPFDPKVGFAKPQRAGGMSDLHPHNAILGGEGRSHLHPVARPWHHRQNCSHH